jgi:hypothetical protein
MAETRTETHQSVSSVLGARFSLKQLLQLQLLVASLFPTVATIIIGAVMSRFMNQEEIGSFLGLLLLCAAALFLGERTIITRMQHMMKIQFVELTNSCQEFMDGNKKRRAPVRGDGEFATLVKTVNTLMDQHRQQQIEMEQQPQPASVEVEPVEPKGQKEFPIKTVAKTRKLDITPMENSKATRNLDITPMENSKATRSLVNINPASKAVGSSSNGLLDSRQLYTFIQELALVLEGDLRVKLTVPDGNIGVLAEICNALIEKLVQFSRWTLYSAEKTIRTSRGLLDHSVVQARMAETQIIQLANIIGTLEGVVASGQRLSSTLHLGAEGGHEIYRYLMQYQRPLGGEMTQVSTGQMQALAERDESPREDQESVTAATAPHLLIQLVTNTQRQIHLLEEASRTLSESTDITEAGVGDLYTVVQRLHESSIGVLKRTEQVGSLIDTAEEWKTAIEGLRLPEVEEEELAKLGEETEWLL